MSRVPFVLLFVVVFSLKIWAQADLLYYLPEGVAYNQNIPTPKSIIGHEVGDWHITHDKLVYYFHNLADISSRVKVERFGQTYEYRPLLNVIITSAENHKKLDQIRQTHLKLSDPIVSENLDLQNVPVIIRLGYSVHGNEQSGANASLLVAYHLAAAQGAAIDEILDNCIILIDPCLNPDGMQRFSTWVNEYKSKNLNSDPNGSEFSEPWPNGRTNHYWFDLNRDWLLAQHPESIARLKVFHDWLPNVQTDHHEMGSDATFFFQPGVPARKHPLIPDLNVTLTEKIGEFHARALDKYKRLYYTKESFDDFFYGKGSTYPDLHGGVGILFEQASVRGHLRETQNGILSFPAAIKNQFIVSLSTIDAAHNLKEELLDYQRNFYKNATQNNKIDENRALIFGTNHDPARTILLGQVLLSHNIKMYKPRYDIELDSKNFLADKSIVIPLNQTQNKLIKAIFERRTSFQDSLFYDISTWNFDLSYNVDLAWFENKSTMKILGEQIVNLQLPKGEIVGKKSYAYAIDWNQYFAPGFV
ncbi:MAG: zinc carboxypeptidase, partial [Cyclobacteriaceae bacterium]|nr:zinc carboxypeptidase [Cyclobacteriaceae bacterium]